MFFMCMIFSTILDFFYFLGTKSHLRRTSHKVPPKPETLAKIQDSKIWKMENEFYQFVRKQFRFVRSQIFQLVNGQYVEKSNRFHFEKIRPRWADMWNIGKHQPSHYFIIMVLHMFCCIYKCPVNWLSDFCWTIVLF